MKRSKHKITTTKIREEKKCERRDKANKLGLSERGIRPEHTHSNDSE